MQKLRNVVLGMGLALGLSGSWLIAEDPKAVPDADNSATITVTEVLVTDAENPQPCKQIKIASNKQGPPDKQANLNKQGKRFHEKGMFPPMPKDPEYKKLWSEDWQLEKKTMELLKKYQKAKDDAKPALEAQLKATVTEHFQARQKRRMYELEKMEQRIQNFRKELEQRGNNAEKIVNDRLRQLLQNDESSKF